jgi:4-amino-4-deoxy-L-arabinose transferase-like glycosyltransferase
MKFSGVSLSRVTLAFVIALIGFVLRLFMAVMGPIEYDEPVYVDAAIHYAMDIRSGHWDQIVNSEENYEHPIFNKLLYSLPLLAFKPISGTSMPMDTPIHDVPDYYRLLAMRLISVTAGTGVVFLLSLINPIAGLAFAVHTFAIKYTSVIYLEAVPLLASLGALLALQKTFAAPADRNKPDLNWLITGAVLAGMAAASKYIYAVVIAAAALAILLEPNLRSPKKLLWLGTWGLLSLFFFGLFDPVLWPAPVARLLESFQFSVRYSGQDPVVVQKAYPVFQPIYWLMLSIPHHAQKLQPFFYHTGDFLVLADTLIFVLAVIGLPTLVRHNRPMAIWLGLGLIFLLFWKTKWPQYVLLILPPFCLSAADGFERMRERYVRMVGGMESRD